MILSFFRNEQCFLHTKLRQYFSNKMYVQILFNLSTFFHLNFKNQFFQFSHSYVKIPILFTYLFIFDDGELFPERAYAQFDAW